MVDQPESFTAIFNEAYGSDQTPSDATEHETVLIEPAAEKAVEESAATPVSKALAEGAEKSEKPDASPGKEAPSAEADQSATQAEPAPEYATGRLSAEEKALLEALPRDAQALVKQVLARQDASHTRRMQEIASTRKKYAAIDEVLEQNRERWSRAGLTSDQAVRNLIAVEQHFARDPSAALNWLADKYGVRLQTGNGNAQTSQPQQEAQTKTPYDLESIRKLIQEQTQEAIKPFVTQQYDQLVNQMETLKQEFQSKHQYKDFLPLVEAQVPGFIQMEQRSNPNGTPMEWLDAATTKALWANEQTKAVLLDAALKEEREKAIGTAKGRVTKAKLAASSVTGAPAPSLQRQGVIDLDEVIAQALAGQGM